MKELIRNIALDPIDLLGKYNSASIMCSMLGMTREKALEIVGISDPYERRRMGRELARLVQEGTMTEEEAVDAARYPGTCAPSVFEEHIYKCPYCGELPGATNEWHHHRDGKDYCKGCGWSRDA